jgi:hypothetical protein
VIRRSLLAGAIALAALVVTAPAQATTQSVGGDTSGCVVIIPANIAVCIGRF